MDRSRKKNLRIKILFILPSLSFGGAQRVMLNILSNIDKNQFDPVLVVGDVKGHFADSIPKGIEIIDLQAVRVRSLVIKLIPLLWRVRPHILFSTLGYLNVLIMFFRVFMPGQTVFIGRETNIPSLHLAQSPFPRIMKFLYKYLYPKFDVIICQSTDMRSDMEDNFGLPSKKAVIINNPVDTEIIATKAKENSPKLFKSRYNLLAAGKLMPQKGFDLLINALSKTSNSEICLTILGEGPCRQELEQLSMELNIADRIDFHGVVSNPYPYMANADLFVLSSRYEGFPNVVLEAMACGTPVLSFNCPGGLDEIIDHGVNGWLVEQGNIDKLSEIMDKSVRYCFNGKAIRQSVKKRFGVEAIIKSYQKLFVSCLP